MHPAIQRYTEAKNQLPSDPPFEADLAVGRAEERSVYTVLPLTMWGYAFVVDHQSAGTIDLDGDALLVPRHGIGPFLDDVFDEGLKIL